jgi:hypothetical protein
VWRGFVDIKALPRPVRSTPRRFLVAESRDHFVASSLSDGGPGVAARYSSPMKLRHAAALALVGCLFENRAER